jgi:hypothetical protein
MGRELLGGVSTSVMREVSSLANKRSGMTLTQKYVNILNSICGNYNIATLRVPSLSNRKLQYFQSH